MYSLEMYRSVSNPGFPLIYGGLSSIQTFSKHLMVNLFYYFNDFLSSAHYDITQ